MNNLLLDLFQITEDAKAGNQDALTVLAFVAIAMKYPASPSDLKACQRAYNRWAAGVARHSPVVHVAS